MTNEQALAEFRYSVNHWFKFMDQDTRHSAVQIAALAITEVNHDVTAPPAIDAAKVAKITEKDYNNHPVSAGRGKYSIGLTWMLNKATGERARVSQDQVQSYIFRGFIKAGPRSAA